MVISIHAPREGGDYVPRDMTVKVHISIHAPREGGDTWGPIRRPSQLKISIHAPREGGDCMIRWICLMYPLFQSTPPARGATSGW